MRPVDVPECGGLLVVPLGAAMVRGALVPCLGQPAGLGERVAGVVVGHAVLGGGEPAADMRPLGAERGVRILLCAMGCEMHRRQLPHGGGAGGSGA